MRRCLLPLVWSPLIMLMVLLPKVASAAEEIRSFQSSVNVHPSGSMTMTETIIVNAEGNQIRHGIYRDFPTHYKDRYGNRYVVGFTVQQVLRDGHPEDYRVTGQMSGERVYIGNKNILLPPGLYSYTITYETNRQLGFFKDRDELYWNVTGNGWGFPILSASAIVQLPPGAAANVTGTNAYTGPQGAQGKDFTISRDGDALLFSSTRPFGRGEGLTIVVDWKKGFVHEPTASEKMGYILQDNLHIIVGLLGLIVVFLYYLIVWLKVGKDPSKGTIIPLYTPPNNLSPAAMRFISRMGYDDKTFAALLINMAVKGAIHIKEERRTYTIAKTGDTVNLSDDERLVLQALALGNDGSIELKQENHERIKQALTTLKKSLKTRYEKTYFVSNLPYFIGGMILSLFAAVLMVLLVPGSAKGIALFLSVWLMPWTIGVFGMGTSIVNAWKNNKFISAIFLTLFSLPFVAAEVVVIGILSFTITFIGAGIIIAVASLTIVFYHLLKAPTSGGRKVMDQIEGFKLYLNVAEKDEMNIVPPEKNIQTFEKYLAYALALDVENRWSAYFAKALSGASVGDSARYAPTWYQGGSWAALSATSFASSFGSSLSSAISSSSHAPGSSGGGGGSSGGGGGGGGGGGW